MLEYRREYARWLLVGVAALVVLACSFVVQRLSLGTSAAPRSTGAARSRPGRIVSLAPSITECLFALGLGEAVVGVTRYCDYPPEATTRPSVGGYFDPNYEAMTALNPDMVVMMPEHEQPRAYLRERGIEVLTVNHRTLAGILGSLRQIGDTCGVPERAHALVRELERRMNAVARATDGVDRPSVMVVVGRDISANRIEEVFVAGDGGWYEELIELAGGVNAYQGGVSTPTVSAEGIISMNPDVIVEILGDTTSPDIDRTKVLSAWDSLPGVAAVKQGRVHLFTDDFAVIPGPRFVLILEKLARALHPELGLEPGDAAVSPGFDKGDASSSAREEDGTPNSPKDPQSRIEGLPLLKNERPSPVPHSLGDAGRPCESRRCRGRFQPHVLPLYPPSRRYIGFAADQRDGGIT